MENNDEVPAIASFVLVLAIGVSIWLVKESGDWMNLVYIYGGIGIMFFLGASFVGSGMDEGSAGVFAFLIYFVGNFVIYGMTGNPAFVAIPVGVSASLMVVSFFILTQ